MTAVDLYCERIAQGLLGEPFNAATNLAILLAAWMAWRDAHRAAALTPGIGLLIALLASFGFGSMLFHTFANNITRWLDILPIAAFIATYLWLYLRRVVGVPVAAAWLAVAAFVMAWGVARQFSYILNGSIIYAPALALVLGLGVVHWMRAQAERGTLLAAAGVFAAALFFRTIDNAMCAAFPVGTHFMWHLFAAVAIYLAMRALIASASGGAIATRVP